MKIYDYFGNSIVLENIANSLPPVHKYSHLAHIKRITKLHGRIISVYIHAPKETVPPQYKYTIIHHNGKKETQTFYS